METNSQELYDTWKIQFPGVVSSIRTAVFNGDLNQVKEIVLCEKVPPCARSLLVEERFVTGDNLLHMAATDFKAGAELVEFLITDCNADIESRGPFGATALLKSAAFGNFAVLKLLVERGADINAADNNGGAQAIHLAAQMGNLDIVRYLLELQPNLFETRSTIFGRTPLLEAASGDSVTVFKFLLEKGANLFAADHQRGAGAIHLAAQFGNIEAVSYLLEVRPQLLETKNTSDGGTSLLHAALGGSSAVVELLLRKGANVCAKFNDGRNALHVAAYFGHLSVASILLLQDVPLFAARDMAGLRPMDYAIEQKQVEIVTFMRQHNL